MSLLPRAWLQLFRKVLDQDQLSRWRCRRIETAHEQEPLPIRGHVVAARRAGGAEAPLEQLTRGANRQRRTGHRDRDGVHAHRPVTPVVIQLTAVASPRGSGATA